MIWKSIEIGRLEKGFRVLYFDGALIPKIVNNYLSKQI